MSEATYPELSPQRRQAAGAPARSFSSVAAALPRGAAVVAAGTLAVSLIGQLALPLPFTPVPLTLGTFAVLTVAGLVGPIRGAAAMALFVGLGSAGLPVFAGFAHGIGGPTTGYLVGYVVAAALVGRLARPAARPRPRRLAPLVAIGRLSLTMAAGSLVIALSGASWLALGVGWSDAFALGVAPFWPGDTIKVLAAAGIVHAAASLGARRAGA
jgi:biotin transport system substrate-specific component